MNSYIAIAISIAFSVFVSFISKKNKPLIFGIAALLSILPCLYIVRGTASVMAELNFGAVMDDIARLVTLFVQEPIRLLKREQEVQHSFAIFGIVLFLAFVFGIGQALMAKKEIARVDLG